MAAGKIGVTEGTNKDLQTFVNDLGDGDVHIEAVALVDTAGAAITTLPVSGTVNVGNFPATQPISGTVNVGNFPATQPVSGTVNIGNFPATQPVSGSVNIGNFPAVQPASQSGTWYVQAINSTSTVNSPNASNFLATVSGTVAATQSGTWIATQTNASNFLSTVSGTVTAIQSNASNFLSTTKETRSGTATTSAVADTNVSTTLLSANANRLGASVVNDSNAVLYVKCGTTASNTDYTVRMVQYAYYEVPFNYTGRIDGIWASDPNTGSARITEFT